MTVEQLKKGNHINGRLRDIETQAREILSFITEEYEEEFNILFKEIYPKVLEAKHKAIERLNTDFESI